MITHIPERQLHMYETFFSDILNKENRQSNETGAFE